jgi:hypothetical protein
MGFAHGGFAIAPGWIGREAAEGGSHRVLDRTIEQLCAQIRGELAGRFLDARAAIEGRDRVFESPADFGLRSFSFSFRFRFRYGLHFGFRPAAACPAAAASMTGERFITQDGQIGASSAKTDTT